MKGLACDFSLDYGRFNLTQGPNKASRDVWFYCVFDTHRPYNSSYGLNVRSTLQKPLSTLLLGRTLFFNTVKNGLENNVSLIEVNNVDVGYDVSDRKQYKIKIDFSYRGSSGSEDTVIFV